MGVWQIEFSSLAGMSAVSPACRRLATVVGIGVFSAVCLSFTSLFLLNDTYGWRPLNHEYYFPGSRMFQDSVVCRIPSFAPPEVAVVGNHCKNYTARSRAAAAIVELFPAINYTALEALQPIMARASMRNGYRYAFSTAEPVSETMQASQVVIEQRLMCKRAQSDWGVFCTGARKLLATDVDAAAVRTLGVPLVSSRDISAAGTRQVVAAASRLGAEDAAAAALQGLMSTSVKVLMFLSPWAAGEASNDEWGRVLSGKGWQCEGQPSQNPSCLQKFMVHSDAEFWQSMSRRQRLGARLAHRGVIPLGVNDVGTRYGLDGGGRCLQCMSERAADGLFFLWEPAWLRQPYFEATSASGTHDKPLGLLSHSACQARGPRGDAVQCGLPVVMHHAEDAGGGDALTCADGSCSELLNRTAFLQNGIMEEHHTHKLFHYFTAAVGLMHDFSSDPERDVLASAVAQMSVDISPVSPQAQLLRPGVLNLPADRKAHMSCFRSSVIGTAGICPNHICSRILNRKGADIVAGHLAKRLGALLAPPLPQRSRHEIAFLQRLSSSRMLVNGPQIVDILSAFEGVEVRQLKLEGASMAQQASAFSRISMLVTPHGNALGNMLWLPRGAAVMEALGEGFKTGFFSGLAPKLDLNWAAVHCDANMTQVALDEQFVSAQLDKLATAPVVGSWVGKGTKKRLLEVQKRIERGQYRLPDASNFSARTTLTPGWDVVGANTRCQQESTYVDKGDTDPKRHHVYIPAAQFLSAFVDLAVRMSKSL